MVGMAALPFLPVTGTVMIARAEQSADLTIEMARRDARFYRALIWFLQFSTWAQVGTIVGTWGIAAGVDVGFIPEQALVAQKLIGAEIREVNEARASQNGSQADEPVQWALPHAVA